MFSEILIHLHNYGHLFWFYDPSSSLSTLSWSHFLNLNPAFDQVPHTLFPHKLSALGFSGGYVNWFCSYLTNRHSQIRISGTVSSHFKVLFSVIQGSVLRHLLFNMCTNNLCDIISTPDICSLQKKNILSHWLSWRSSAIRYRFETRMVCCELYETKCW
jgi:hypothetical protein